MYNLDHVHTAIKYPSVIIELIGLYKPSLCWVVTELTVPRPLQGEISWYHRLTWGKRRGEMENIEFLRKKE